MHPEIFKNLIFLKIKKFKTLFFRKIISSHSTVQYVLVFSKSTFLIVLRERGTCQIVYNHLLETKSETFRTVELAQAKEGVVRDEPGVRVGAELCGAGSTEEGGVTGDGFWTLLCGQHPALRLYPSSRCKIIKPVSQRTERPVTERANHSCRYRYRFYLRSRLRAGRRRSPTPGSGYLRPVSQTRSLIIMSRSCGRDTAWLRPITHWNYW